jgi:hypothetical protein
MVVRPRVKLLKAKSAVDPSKNTSLVRLRIFWSPPHANGCPVEKYQLQVKEELDLDLVGPETFSRAPIAGGGHGGEHGGEAEEDDLGMIGRVPQQVHACRVTTTMSRTPSLSFHRPWILVTLLQPHPNPPLPNLNLTILS